MSPKKQFRKCFNKDRQITLNEACKMQRKEIENFVIEAYKEMKAGEEKQKKNETKETQEIAETDLQQCDVADKDKKKKAAEFRRFYPPSMAEDELKTSGKEEDNLVKQLDFAKFCEKAIKWFLEWQPVFIGNEHIIDWQQKIDAKIAATRSLYMRAGSTSDALYETVRRELEEEEGLKEDAQATGSGLVDDQKQ